MNIKDFEKQLSVLQNETDLNSFCQEHMLHGTPFVFEGRESDYFSFKKRICGNFALNPADIFIVGSGKLGFSPFKKTAFSLDSDIDLALISNNMFADIGEMGLDFEYSLRASEDFLTSYQKDSYFRYLRYRAIGWTRP